MKSVIKDVVDAVEETRKESSRDMHLLSHKDSNQTVEFDIAVSAEDTTKTGGKAGIRVLQFVEGGGEINKEIKSSTVSRVKFGVYISTITKSESAHLTSQYENNRNNRGNDYI
ncbi:MAG: hypothetical protein WDK96_01410 [Candidatus Paceibacterota bacterium]